MIDVRRTLLGALVLTSVGATGVLVVASPLACGALAVAWLAWQLSSLSTNRLPARAPTLLAVLAVTLGAALYRPGHFAMYSADALELVGRLEASQWRHLLSWLAGPAADLLAPNDWLVSSQLLTGVLAISTLCFFYAATTRAVDARVALVMSALVAVSPTFLRLSMETPAPLLVCTLALAAVVDSQRFNESGEWTHLARSALGAVLASYALSGFFLMPLVMAVHWIAWAHRSRVAWLVLLLAQIGLVAALAPSTSASHVPGLHASAIGILWSHQFVHPVFATLGVLGFLGLLASRPATACAAAIAATIAVTSEQWGLDPLLAATLLFPLSWLVIGAGVATLDPRLRQRRGLVYLSLAFVVIHHQWLFHGLFGRVLLG